MTDVVVHERLGMTLPFHDQCWQWSLAHPRRLTLSDGERIYVVSDGGLWGYTEVRQVDHWESSLGFTARAFCSPAVRVALPCRIRPFVGLRYRWWNRSAEQPEASFRASTAI